MKKNLRKKALVPALAMVLAAVIALSGVTYAWFTVGNTANINNLNVNVKTADGIQISLDGKSWKSTIATKDILAAIDNENYGGRCILYPTGEIAPVSTAGNFAKDDEGKEIGKLEMFYGEFNEDGTLKSVALKEKNGDEETHFIAFDLFFKYSGNQSLYLNVGKGMSVVSTISLDEEGKATLLTEEADMGTRTAVRVAFVPMGSYDTDVEARNQTEATAAAKIWEPNSETRATGSEGGIGKLPYDGFVKAFDNNGQDYVLTDGQTAAVTTFDETATLMDLSKTYSKIRVYIWLEGQDVDCINNISNGDFQVTLQFAVPDEDGNTIKPTETTTPSEPENG